MNHIEFRLCYNLANKYWVLLDKKLDGYIPVVGSIVNIKGNPFIIYEVSCAYAENSQQSFTYVNVFKAGKFKLKIGKTSY